MKSYDMISEANRIIEQSSKRRERQISGRKNRAVFRFVPIAAITAAAVLCALLLTMIFKK